MTVVREVVGVLRRYVRELTGEAAYDRYCARHRRRHPQAPVPTRREYQRMRELRSEGASPGRCC
ncbi:YbdD/YjiX family protein [Streptomyces sp. SS7]|uniref:YbdD/YjiX family protein n=1 Tax=Streptomyces sp. SS7 TaxID=3108485 RepID=UPI0030EE74F9